MAAKLKKRALAEFNASQTMTLPVPPTSGTSVKKLKISGSSKPSSDFSSLTALNFPNYPENYREISSFVVGLISKLPKLNSEEVKSVFNKLNSLLETCSNNVTKTLLISTINTILSRQQQSKNTKLINCFRDKIPLWTSLLQKEKNSSKTLSALLNLFTTLYKNNANLISHNIYDLALQKLTHVEHTVQQKSLELLGVTLIDKHQVFDICSKYTQSQDPRVRVSAFETLLFIHKNGNPLNVSMYENMCSALNDDYEGVRSVGLQLVYELSRTYPDHLMDNELRLVDDGFAKICNGINDVSLYVRELSAKLMGYMDKGISQIFLEQTLDKKLMSNMRLKKSAHEREAKKLAAGEWSSGRNWADDAPKQEIDAEAINLMSSGACGAFIHGLEDEYMAVRSEAVDSLTKLSISNPKLAVLSLDFLGKKLFPLFYTSIANRLDNDF